MAEPFVFRFAPGEHGIPQVMYVADVRCECGLCGHPQMQRFYHATPLHPLTVEVLAALAREVYLKAGYECENCGEFVGPQHVHDAALTYGFADDAGVIRAFVVGPAHKSAAGVQPGAEGEGAMKFELIARRRLDPQELPGWQPAAERGVVSARLSEAVVERELGRAFSPKLLWLELFEDWREDPEGGAFAQAGPGYWLLLEKTELLAGELGEAIEDEEYRQASDAGDIMVIDLLESTPEGLATHARPEAMPGRWQAWLPDWAQTALNEGEAWAEAHVSRAGVVDQMRRAFDLARLTYRVDETAVDVFFSEITTPGQEVYGRGVSVSSVLRRAVYTGITPGEAARLTAEEIVGMLLRVW